MLLDYEVVDYSSYSSSYLPNNIKSCSSNGVVNDQSSRWSSNSNNQQQYLTLKLKHPSSIKSILFGKFHKVHVCNLKEFKVFLSYNNKQYIQVLHEGLKNDSEPESFAIHTDVKGSNNVLFPAQYIKITPLVAHGANFNFSIWYLELHGSYVDAPVVQAYTDYHNETSLKVILKFFRQNNAYLSFYTDLQASTNISLEHPYLKRMYDLIVAGNFEESFEHLKAADIAWFESYLSSTLYAPQWQKLLNCDKNGAELPSRGGHQMAMTKNGIYLYGGWNGTQDLNDLWFYDTTWRLVNYGRSSCPSPRSCHKMIYNPNDDCLYVFGRYIDQDSRTTTSLLADFWRYSISSNKWEEISKDTKSEQGPGLLFDHQMVIDEANNDIYVFGGKVVMATTETVYSGFYKYSINTSQWVEVSANSDPSGYVVIKPRISHTMLLHQKRNCIYIFSGQRFKDYLADMYEYDIEQGTIKELSRDYSKQGGPVSGYTQRATLDEERDEIYVFSGLIRDKFSSQDTVKNTFWVYNIKTSKWRMVFQNTVNESISAVPGSPESEAPGSPAMATETEEPVPRYAHQLVYNSQTKLHYLFGGNPGSPGNPKERLNDFWGLALIRPTPLELVQKIRLILKTQQFKELCAHDSVSALKFLHQNVAPLIDHEDLAQRQHFQSLTQFLFTTNDHNLFKDRIQVYDDIVAFFPQEMKQPEVDLMDLIPIDL